MVAKIRRGEREFEVPDGNYTDFDELNRILQGHPNGINQLVVGEAKVKLNVRVFGSDSDPVIPAQTEGDLGDFVQRIDIGQFETDISFVLFNGSGMNLKSQGGEIQIKHINK